MNSFLKSLPILFFGLVATYSSASANSQLEFAVNTKNGSYTIGLPGKSGPVLTAGVAIQVDGRWVRSVDFPKHNIVKSSVVGMLGDAEEWIITCSGLQDAPELVYQIRLYKNVPFGELHEVARNTTKRMFHVEAFRLIDTDSPSILDLAGPAMEDRVLSDSFSEDAPAMAVRDLGDAEKQMHRGMATQLVYNRRSHLSWFVGALTADRFLSIIRLHTAAPTGETRIASYEVESTGTTELTSEYSLRDAPPEDRIQLSLPLAAGEELASEKFLFSVSDDYHQQLETYGKVVRELHHARVTAPPALGWWSWTAYYSGLNEAAALTNAQYLAQNLKPLGYNYFHVDEGYQFARGEYQTPDAGLFPHGMAAFEKKVVAMGLTPGIWTAPFQVSERSWVYETHPDWLVKNAKGAPIHSGLGANETDRLFVLDPTNPEAQKYLRSAYQTLANIWNCHFFKLDFMDASAVEGYYFRPNTTALEAQRIGLKIIRDAVGENVLLDKDGSTMLSPVGYVDMGRISEDTGHTFAATKEVATGIAARYYMNRNWFVNDPDAFTVSKQTIPDGEWHESTIPLTLDEAKVSIALAAISGGMFEIGDDLPTLGNSPERLALVTNRDLLDMAQLGRASTPLDLMTFEPADQQPSLFLLKENARQTILTAFNWTDKARTRNLALSAVGLKTHERYAIVDTLDDASAMPVIDGIIKITQPAHSVRVLKIIDKDMAALPPTPQLEHATRGTAGTSLVFNAQQDDSVVRYRWDFGDGIVVEGKNVTHAYTYAGNFTVKFEAIGLQGLAGRRSFPISITGRIPTKFVPKEKIRFENKN